MEPEAYNQFTTQLTNNLQSDPRVIGLVAAGSMAALDYQPDQWSDHDFFVIVQDGVQNALKDDLSWLPDAAEIVLAFRETEHGMKVLYRSGHLLEFALFTLEELAGIRLNRYRVLVDKGDVGARMGRAAAETAVSQSPTDPDNLFAQFLVNLLVGAWRYARGEALSGRQFVQNHAVYQLLKIWPQLFTAENGELLDNLDPFRRVELVYPALGRELTRILALPMPETAVQLLDFAARECGPRLTAYPETAVAVVAAQLQHVKRVP